MTDRVLLFVCWLHPFWSGTGQPALNKCLQNCNWISYCEWGVDCNSWTSKPIVRTSSLPSTLPKQKSLYLAVSHWFLSQTFPECLLWVRFCYRWWIRHNTSSQPGLLFKWRRLIILSNWQMYPNTKGSIFNTNPEKCIRGQCYTKSEVLGTALRFSDGQGD